MPKEPNANDSYVHVPIEILEDEQMVPVHHESQQPRPGRLKRLAAAALVGVTTMVAVPQELGGETAQAASVQVSEAQPGVDMHVTIPGFSKADGATRPSTALVGEFQKALDEDECVSVKAVDAATIYHNVFETDPYEHMNHPQLMKEVPKVLHAFETARNNVWFPELPADYDELVSDSQSDKPSLSIQKYEQAFTEAFGQVGIPVHFNWKIPKSQDIADSKGMPSKAAGVPYTKAELSEPEMRQALLTILQDLTSIPRDTLEQSKLPGIYIGKDRLPDAAAFVAGAGDTEYMFLDPILDSAGTLGHEEAHAQQSTLCYGVIDSAWANLNPAKYQYGHSETDKFNDAEDAVNGDGKGQVVAAEPYGDTDANEDIATLVGGYRFLYPDGGGLFMLPAKDRTVPDKKLALYIAREFTQSPDVAAYFIQLAKLEQLEAAISNEVNKSYAEDSAANTSDENSSGQVEQGNTSEPTNSGSSKPDKGSANASSKHGRNDADPTVTDEPDISKTEIQQDDDYDALARLMDARFPML